MASVTATCDCIERRNTLDINWTAETVVNHSSQKCRRRHLNFNAHWVLLPWRKLQWWRDRWLMGHCATAMCWSVNINATSFAKIIMLQSRDSNHKSIRGQIAKKSIIAGWTIWITCISPHKTMFTPTPPPLCGIRRHMHENHRILLNEKSWKPAAAHSCSIFVIYLVMLKTGGCL